MCVGGRRPDCYRIGEVNKYQQKAMTLVMDLHGPSPISSEVYAYLPLRVRESSIRLAEIVWHNMGRVLVRTSQWHVL